MKLYEMTAHELTDMLKKRDICACDITESVLTRISNVEDKVNAYITILGKDALNKAKEADKAISYADSCELRGIPYALKDVLCTKNIQTTCGSHMLEGFIPPYNATVVEKLDSEGCILVGKTNMDEFAMGSSTENSYYKTTGNPYDTSRVPGGSSGGSAAAVAADECIFALGSDTGGSVRQPASFCGIVGMKPTYGMVSRFGLVAYASSLDQIGPMTKDVTDCATILNAITGHDKMDSTSLNVDYPDYKKALVPDVKGMRIGLPKEYFAHGISDDVKEPILAAAKHFESLGAKIDECSLPMTDYALPAYYLIACAEASSNLARYDGIKYGYRAKEFDGYIDLYLKSRSQGFGEETKRRILLGTHVLSSGYYDAYYKKAQQTRTLIKNNFDNVFKSFDFLLTPASPVAAWKFGEMSNDPIQMYLADICTVSVNVAGIPAIVLPCGMDKNSMPVGMQLIGPAFSESSLIRAAYTYEQSTTHHKMRPAL